MPPRSPHSPPNTPRLPPQITYIHRKTNAFFSIEKVFRLVAGNITAGGRWKTEDVTVPRPGFSPAVLLENIRFVRRLESDIFHITGDVHYVALGLPRDKTILTIHDLVFMYQTRGPKRWILQRLLLKWPLRRVKIVTTVSEQTKKDILRFSGCPEDKVVVIPNPLTGKITHSEHPFSAGKPVILFIGTTPNKNLDRVIPALQDLPCRLSIIGKLPEGTSDRLRAAGIDFTNTFGLSDDEMDRQYAEADIVLFPSTFEGFGLPIIEAQTAGRVVVTSRLSPMKDVAGDGACLVDPYDVASIREGIISVIRQPDYRQRLIENGLANIRRFDPGAIALRYEEVYKSILS